MTSDTFAETWKRAETVRSLQWWNGPGLALIQRSPERAAELVDRALFGGDEEVLEIWEEWLVGLTPDAWKQEHAAIVRRLSASERGDKPTVMDQIDAAAASGMPPEELDALIAKLRKESAGRG